MKAKVAVFAAILVTLAPMSILASSVDSIQLQVQRFSTIPATGEKLDSLHEMVQDQQGFLWLASETGLLRFDGHEIVKFDTHNSEISSDLCWAITIDQQGKLWIATTSGLNLFDPLTEQFTSYLHDKNNPQSIASNFITNVAVMSDNSVYVATLSGISIIAPDRQTISHWTANTPDIPLQSNRVRAIFEDAKGDVWIGYDEVGVSWFKKQEGVMVHFNDSHDGRPVLPTIGIRNIAEDKQGRIWLGTWGKGLVRLDNSRKSMTYYPPGLDVSGFEKGIVEDILVDNQGLVWIAMDKGGVAVFDEPKNKFRNFVNNPLDQHSLLSNTIRNIYQDRHDNVWFIGFPGGLNRYHHQTDQFKRWRHNIFNDESLSHSAILSLYYHAPFLWVGTENGLNQLNLTSDNIAHYPFSEEQGFLAPAITALGGADKTGIWVGTWSGGLAYLNTETGAIKHYQYGSGAGEIEARNIWAIYRDSEQRLWVGSETAGLFLFHPKTDRFSRFSTEEPEVGHIRSNYIFDIQEDSQGMLWLATQDGVEKFDPRSRLPVYVDGLSHHKDNKQRVKSLLIRESGEIWMASQTDGILIWDSQKALLSKIGVDNGLPDFVITSLEEDSQGKVWATSLSGLIKIDAARQKVERIYTEKNGIAGDISNRRASVKTAHGAMYFGSTNGLYGFDPDKLDSRTMLPDPKVAHITLIGGKARGNSARTIHYTSIDSSKKLTIEKDTAVIRIEFTNLNFAYGNSTRYSYKLDGYDEGWEKYIGNGTVSYVDIPPGDYTFYLRAQDMNLKWSDHVQQISLRKMAHWWQSNLAKVLYAIFAIVFLFIIVRLIALRLINRKLAAQVAQRTNDLLEANSAKSDFLANVSHELRTPLNAVIGYSSLLLRKCPDDQDSQITQGLNVILRNGQLLNHLIDDLLDLSKIESGKMTIDLQTVDLKKVVEQSLEDNLARANEKDIELIAPENYPVKSVQADPQRLTQILNNLISNGIKYTEIGKVWLEVYEESDLDKTYCVISVKDTGIGISEDNKKKIFSRFEQLDTSTKYIKGYGTGLGLSIVDELVKLHGGKIRFQSRLGQGSEFDIMLLIAKSDRQLNPS